MPGLAALACLSLLAIFARADSGVLIPRDKQAPDAAILSLEDMQVRVTIDHGDAHVFITQVFANHTGKIEEGTYHFALPSGATVSDFAVWDGPVRIPAVILEKRRASEVYAEAKSQAIDPGLLQMGERDDADPRQSAEFTATIVPIAPYGTKRMELDYHQRLTVSDFKQFFALALKPDAAGQFSQGPVVARHFRLDFTLLSALALHDLQMPAKSLPLTLTTQTAERTEGSFEAANLTLSEDFQATWSLEPGEAGKLQVAVHRDDRVPLPNAGEAGPAGANVPEPGFFQAQMLMADPASAAPATQAPRTAILLFDNSLSMQWEKLERSFAALEATLRTLRPQDRFNVLLFNQDVTAYQPQPVAATGAAVEAALGFVRGSRLRGGTDLLKALEAGLAQATVAGTDLIVLTDGGSNRGASVLPAKISAAYTARWKALPHPPRTNVFAVGDDADLHFLRALARNNGVLESVLSNEPYDFKLKAFLSKITRTPVAGLALAPNASLSLVYPMDDTVYPGSTAEWVGQYRPGTATTVRVSGSNAGKAFTAEAGTPLPATELAHPQLPRLWAQARVDALLAQIDRDGETAAAIDEILRLSRRYKFVTPYTSFLAVPRSLLRPRVIRPGDPVLRVRTDPAIESVIAVFPFGLTKPLRHLAAEDNAAPTPDAANRLWETRFLAPDDMKDGTYHVRLILRDHAGHLYNEAKSFVIASTPPTVRIELSRRSFRRGEAVEVAAEASASTRTLTARLDGAAPVTLRWNAAAHRNIGLLAVPPGLPAGSYRLTVTAEDVAHNIGSAEVQVDVH